MEYNLLKTIEPNLGLQMCPVPNPHLTPYPAIDYVNPGLGQAARLYSFYVPLHSNQSPLNIDKKKDDALLQEGGSSEMTSVETSEDLNEDIDPIEFNNRKRKLMGDAIQSSFMHPKILTDSLELEPQSKVKKKEVIMKSEPDRNKQRGLKHKFQFL
jgi:hypothetical protein